MLSLQEFGVNGYPTLKFFGENKRRPLAYRGARDAGAMADFVLAKWAALQPPPEVRAAGPRMLLGRCSVWHFPQHSRNRPSCSLCRCGVANTHECARGPVAHCPALGSNVLLTSWARSGWTQPVCGLAPPMPCAMRCPQVRELVEQSALEDECLGHGARPARKLWCAVSHSTITLGTSRLQPPYTHVAFVSPLPGGAPAQPAGTCAGHPA